MFLLQHAQMLILRRQKSH